MSRTETHSGLLKIIDKLDSETFDNYYLRIIKLDDKSFELDLNMFDNYIEYIEYELYEKYVISNKYVYKFLECNEVNDIDIIRYNDDGTIYFLTQFYNGGTCLNERLENLLNSDNTK